MSSSISMDKQGAEPEPVPMALPPIRSLMPISVNLLPEEVIRARVGASARRVTVIALVVVAALMGAWYFQAHRAASSAQDSLDQANAQNVIAKKSQLSYGKVITTRLQIQALESQLKQVTKGDVAWAATVGHIRAQLPSGLRLNGITGTASTDQQTPVAGDAPAALVLTGYSPSEAGVHQFADQLAKLPELENTFVTSVAATDKGFTYSISVVVNKKALNTRFAKAGTK